jgi:hypothetical protein
MGEKEWVGLRRKEIKFEIRKSKFEGIPKIRKTGKI